MFDMELLSDSLPVRTLEAGEVLLQEGTYSGKAYLLDKGIFEVSREGMSICIVEERGAPFGEISALLRSSHQASVIARTEARVFVIEDFEAFARQNPGMTVHFARILAKRLAVTNEYIVKMQQQFEEAAQEAKSKNEAGTFDRLKRAWDSFGQVMRKQISGW
jgi:CRP-like cAMP-binding protein